ncbi:MAG: hypothetical protein AB1705_02720 [Verrucomicrobiota bacterium]
MKARKKFGESRPFPDYAAFRARQTMALGFVQQASWTLNPGDFAGPMRFGLPNGDFLLSCWPDNKFWASRAGPGRDSREKSAYLLAASFMAYASGPDIIRNNTRLLRFERQNKA